MLQYLAAHPNPRQGFIRALSVTLGQHIKHVPSSHLVKVHSKKSVLVLLCKSVYHLLIFSILIQNIIFTHDLLIIYSFLVQHHQVLWLQPSFNVSFHLILQSTPSIDETTELGPSELDQSNSEAETLCESSTSLEEPEVSVPTLLAVICHRIMKIKDEISLPEDCLRQEDYSEVLPCECSNWDLK